MNILNLINIALGRPSAAKAVLWSFGLHVGVVTVSFCSWSKPVDRTALAGMRNVVQVEAAFLNEPPEPYDEPDFSVEQYDRTPQQIDDANEPRLVSLTRPDPSSEPAKPETCWEDQPRDRQDHAELQAHRRELDERPADVKEVPPQAPRRRVAEIPTPRTSVQAEQVAGIDDKTPPDFQGNPPPPYPATAIVQHIEGTVLLRVYIAATGHVQQVEIATSSGHSILDRAAVEAVSQWRSQPAFRAGVALATVELLPIRFQL